MSFDTSDKIPLDADKVAIGLTHGIFGSHLGVAFHTKEGGAKLLHLANHRLLCFDPYGEKRWITSVVPFEPTEAIQFIALARNYASVHVGKDGPNYGINLLAGKGAIDTEGNYSPSKDSDGFTCASIVAEIFNASAFEVVDLASWQATQQNRVWGGAIVEMLKAGGAHPDHVIAVSKSVNGLRLLPEEFAAAAERSSEHWPTAQGDLTARATALTAEILAKCGPPIQVPEEHPVANAVKMYQGTGRPSAVIVPSASKPIAVAARAPSSFPGQPLSSLATRPRSPLAVPKVGRNDPCPCKSGRKYKHCHGAPV